MRILLLSVLLQISGAQAQGPGGPDPSVREECPSGENSAYRWDEARNRCVLKEEVSRGREAFQRCVAMEEGEKKKLCFEENRDTLVGQEADTWIDPLDGHLSTVTASIPLSFLIVGAITAKAARGGSGCVSKKIFKFTSIAALGAEAYFRLWAKRKMERMQKEYSELQEEESYRMQVAAFKYLEDMHRESAALSSKQRKAYLTFATAFVSSAALATLESAAIFGLTPCGLTSGGTETAGRNPSGSGTVVLPPGAQGGVGRMFNLLGHSPGIAILSGVMTALYGVLAKASGEDHKKSLERAKIVKEIRESFEQMHASAGFCSSREDMARPQCYCYTDNGERHPERTNSETCKALWAQHDRDLFVEANNETLVPGKSPSRRGCVDQGQRFDANCDCLKKIDESGNNSCYKTILSPEANSALTASNTGESILEDIGNITAGGLSAGVTDLGPLEKKAARASLRLKDILKKQDELAKTKGWPSSAEILRPIGASLKGAGSKIATAPLKHLVKATSAMPNSMKTAVRAIEEKAKSKSKTLNIRGGALSPKGKGKKTPFNDSATGRPKVLEDFMDKNYDYSEREESIVDDKGVSLWRIVSARYLGTGLERLFGNQAP